MIDEFDKRMKIRKCDILQYNNWMFAWRALRIKSILMKVKCQFQNYYMSTCEEKKRNAIETLI